MKQLTRLLFEHFWSIFGQTMFTLFIVGLFYWFGPLYAALGVLVTTVGAFVFIIVGVWFGVTIVNAITSARRRLREWAYS